MPSRCHSCGASIRWVKMPSGASMPLDAEPHAEGNIALAGDGDNATVLTKSEREGRGEAPLYRSHFATCSHAARRRR